MADERISDMAEASDLVNAWLAGIQGAGPYTNKKFPASLFASASDMTTALALKAPLASPTFTGNPIVPTQSPGTNNTRAASTAYADAAASAAAALKIGGSTGATDNRLLRSDGTGGLTVQNSPVTVDDSGNMSGVGTIGSGVITATITGSGTAISAVSTDAGSALGPVIETFRDSASPAASDNIGAIEFYGRDSAGNKQLYSRIFSAISDPTSTSEDAGMYFVGLIAGSTATYLSIGATANQIDVNLGQLAFPATQNASSGANVFDDYEEGAWTPNDNSGAGLSFSSVDAAYTKAGREVLARASLTYPSTANGSNASIGGLPFTSANSQSARSGLIASRSGGTATQWIVNANATTAAFSSPGAFSTNANLSTVALFLHANYHV